MGTTFNFGRLRAGKPAPSVVSSGAFRIALLGDFSGRAHRGERRSSDELAHCKPLRLDVDSIDKVIASFGTTLRLPLGGPAEGGMELRLGSLDDLHPDTLGSNLSLFSGLARLRQQLADPRTFAAAAAEVRAWAAAAPAAAAPVAPSRARGNTLRVDAKLSDFARLVGLPAAFAPPPGPIDALLQRIVAPHVVQAAAPDAPCLTAAVDDALSAAMRGVLHDPDFQCLEAAWRSLDFIVRRVETDETLEIVLYDISAEEFAADLSATDQIEDTGLYRLLVEQPASDAHQGSLSALIGHYGFEMTPPHAELLGRIAGIAARARAPFIAAVGRDCIGMQVEDMHPRVVAAWKALRELPAARFLALTVPRFLLRTPYGARTDPIDSFAFEEFDAQAGLKTLLWGNPAVLAAVLLGEHARAAGVRQAPGRLLSVGDMPFFFHTDPDGETVALPGTERLLSERSAAQVHGLGFIPVLAIRGRPELRLGGFLSLAGTPLAGPWTPANGLPEPADDPVPPSAAAVSAPPAAEPAADAELDDLLAALKDSTDAEPTPPHGAIDPALAALLKDL
ncbi:type VI secretion system contractile sheath large subunit [Variovorax humicola]|uniref:Type VI secretion system contractile sheath large subunit n=1 Tax=Variovorax humicola TaxID=1769758 RepID=A0ABU8VYT5_9BURK